MTGDFPCSLCGSYTCNGVHHIAPIYPTVPTWPQAAETISLKWPLEPERLHPDDIEKIAKRVVELLKERK